MTESAYVSLEGSDAVARADLAAARWEDFWSLFKRGARDSAPITPSRVVLLCLSAVVVCQELTGWSVSIGFAQFGDRPYEGDCFQDGSADFTKVAAMLKSAFPKEWTGQAARDYHTQNQNLIDLAHTMTNLDTGMKNVVNGQATNVTNTREKLGYEMDALLLTLAVTLGLENSELGLVFAWPLAFAAVATTASLCSLWMSECHSDSATNAATAQGFDYQQVINDAHKVIAAARGGFPPGQQPVMATAEKKSNLKPHTNAFPADPSNIQVPGSPGLSGMPPHSPSSPGGATRTPAAPITPHPTTTMPAAAAAPFGAPPTLDEISQVSQQVSAPLTMASQTVNQVGQTAGQAAQQIQSLAQSAKGPGSADPAHTPARDDAPTASDGVTPVDTAAASSGPAAGRAPVDAPTPAAASGGDPLAAERSAPN